jgi:hypothetical protein
MATGAGALVGIYVGPRTHLIAAFAAIGVNVLAAVFQYALLHEYRDEARRYLGE